ncbi:phosphatase PAP2 family protein [Paludibacter sp. 221]|uniref:phosphatase PAP2 family protein n=1 Tax=Paludibacter sp. 221 TaxID=2302939 RepID=UPI0013D853CC|nr:phosphatase PAP2 family protein [Paludibacter sp. 221]NDV47656.1 phosphatase PAP2 family protein [Paludibacter sp. 221]
MIDILNTLDTNVFLFLNGIHSAFFDGFMYVFSDKWVWVPFYCALLYVIIVNWKKQSLWIILSLVVCIVLADQISSGIIKNLVERPRPTHNPALEGMVHIVNGYRGGMYGFVSSHAANAFGLALFCSLLFRRKIYSIMLFVWAALTAYSRIYLGVHYPFDIVGGTLVGVFSALLCYAVLKYFYSKKSYSLELDKGGNQTTTKGFLYQVRIYLPLWILLATVVGIVLSSILAL